MPLFSRKKQDNTTSNDKYNYTDNTTQNISSNNDNITPTYVVPSQIVNILNRISRFFISKMYRKPKAHVMFELTEFHIASFIMLSGSIYWALKERKKANKLANILNNKLSDIKYNTLNNIVNLEENSYKIMEILYLKDEINGFHKDVNIRVEFRSHLDRVLGYIKVLSDLQIKILHAINSYVKSNALKNINKNDKKQKKQIESTFNIIEDKIETYQEYFEEKQEDEYIIRTRHDERSKVKQEIMDNEQESGIPGELSEYYLDTYKNNTFKDEAYNISALPIDFKTISPHSCKEFVDEIKYNEIQQQNIERKMFLRKQIGYGIGISLGLYGVYLYNKYHHGKISKGINEIKQAI